MLPIKEYKIGYEEMFLVALGENFKSDIEYIERCYLSYDIYQASKHLTHNQFLQCDYAEDIMFQTWALKDA